MGRSINPDMLIIARESRGLTQTELAEVASISQGNLSKYENGMLSVSQHHLEQIADALDYPSSFFYLPGQRHGVGSNCTYHRKRQSMPVHELKKLHGLINAARIRLGILLTSTDIECENNFPRLDLEEYGDPETIAGIVRELWRLPLGPVNNLVRAIEGAGGIVIRCSFGTRNLDAVSQLIPGLPPLFFVNADTPEDRIRYSLSHEVGHLVMHQLPTPGPKDLEREANSFASEFLMPASDISTHLESLSLQTLPKLKPYWKVSMQALIRRAFDLGKITERQYRAMFEQFSKLGYKKNEPIELPVEQPTVFQDIMDVHRNDYGYSITELSHLLGIHEDEFRRQYLLEPQSTKLRLIG